VSGPGIAPGGAIGIVRQVDVAPTHRSRASL
jgi:hypothetical protein